MPGEGIAWLENYEFSDGTIEFNVRGENVFQKSFVGIAFHGVGETQFQAIYFRPFNFTAGDSLRKIHSVQYIAPPSTVGRKYVPSIPASTNGLWIRLRTRRDGSTCVSLSKVRR